MKSSNIEFFQCSKNAYVLMFQKSQQQKQTKKKHRLKSFDTQLYI